MKYFRIFFIMFVCLYSCKISAHENSYEFMQQKYCKVYVPEKNLLFHDNQIYLSFKGEIEALNAVYCDDKGLYLVVDQKYARSRLGEIMGEIIDDGCCLNGHPQYHRIQDGGCGGCAHWLCPFRCKCCSPWNNQ